MSKNNSKRTILKANYIISSILAFVLTVNLANELTKRIEKGEKTSISTTETTIPTTDLDIESIIQATIPTIEPTIETTIPTTITNNNYNEINIEKYIKAIDKIKVNYKHKKYYPAKKDTFEIFADATTTVTKCEYEFDGNTEVIVNKLFENSQKYINENPKYVMSFRDKNIQNQELIMQQYNFELTLYQILDNWKNNTNNINEDFCSLESYNIVFIYDEEEYKNHMAYTT